MTQTYLPLDFALPGKSQVAFQVSMTWVDFFSNIGGLLGLVLGMGIISFIEIVWLALRLVFQKLDLTDWIS